MEVIVGSENKAKLNAVKAVFSTEIVKGALAPSKVSDQPFSDEETLTGAINRAKYVQSVSTEAIGIGLEGGVMKLDNQLYLCNWGALIDPDHRIFTASGARIPLPDIIAKSLYDGIELGVIIDEYADKVGVSQQKGAIGILTNNQLSRETMFIHIVQQLKGQWLFATNK
ncbi:DUF84 family protein [Amphibacillus cookii]|uniref:DUF84 family protein n=1 Tax=Amphibacillus cookii TaxID=767787 RepID=UPI00195D8FC3|nr:DUF84 family protein [Amphibacillus cookii]MBM7542985.1 inosine/xanthosine triphosphatase [Amphibacillus cookii]